MSWLKQNWGWGTVIVIAVLPLLGILAMVNIDFSGASWISMDSLTLPGRHPGDAPHEVSGVHMGLKETGEWAIRWLVIVLSLTPWGILTGKKPSLYVRQAAGITAFVYSALHLLFFCIERGFLSTFKELGFILGFIAMLVMFILAVTSNRKSMKFLKAAWKKLHRWAYLAALLSILHVVLLKHGDWIPYVIILVVGAILRFRFAKDWFMKIRAGKKSEPVLS